MCRFWSPLLHFCQTTCLSLKNWLCLKSLMRASFEQQFHTKQTRHRQALLAFREQPRQIELKKHKLHPLWWSLVA